MMPPPAISVRGLSKRFDGRTVVDALDLDVAAGRITGFLGPNGSGKTTTLRMLCGLLTPDGGQGTCLGLDIATQSAAIKRRLGYMTQRFSLYDDLSIQENLEFVARVHGLPDAGAQARAVLDRLGLWGRRRQLAGHLSGGWKQRLALAAAILHQPELLLLDEPTAGVDPQARREFWDEIHALAAQGMTVLVSTHYMDEAERCHAIAYLAYGRLLVSGSTAQVIAASGLHTVAIRCAAQFAPERLARLRADLDGRDGINMVAPFGTELHVGGDDPERLHDALAFCRDDPALELHSGSPTLEDAFIHLMGGSASGSEVRS